LIAAGAFVALAAWMLIVGFKRLDPSLGIWSAALTGLAIASYVATARLRRR
jgi:hypothetical protein